MQTIEYRKEIGSGETSSVVISHLPNGEMDFEGIVIQNVNILS